MNPSDDYLQKMTDKVSLPFLKVLYRLYSAENKDETTLQSYWFHTQNLQYDKSFTEKLSLISDKFPNYSDQQLVRVVLNSLDHCGFMTQDTSKFYLTQAGYKKGMKNCNILKYWSSYHSGVFYTILSTVVVAILTTLITA